MGLGHEDSDKTAEMLARVRCHLAPADPACPRTNLRARASMFRISARALTRATRCDCCLWTLWLNPSDRPRRSSLPWNVSRWEFEMKHLQGKPEDP